jgi:hypothetical protein
VFDTHFPYEGAPGTAQAAKGSFRFAVSCAVVAKDPSTSPSGAVGAATGKPRITPPSTSTGPAGSGPTDDSASRLMLIGFGIMIAGILLLATSDWRRTSRRR